MGAAAKKHPLDEMGQAAGESQLGTVVRAISSIYDVRPDAVDGPPFYRCRLRDRLRKELVMSESAGRPKRVRTVRRLGMVEPVVAGDRVRFLPEPTSGTSVPEGVIEEVLPRARALTRQAVTDGSVPVGQTLIANLDQVVIVFAAIDPEPHLGLIDRFIVSCEYAKLPALLCVNKIDLGVDEQLEYDLRAYERAGYRVIHTSAETGQGIDELRAAVLGRTSAFVGASGVGKSTLLNALEPGLALRVGEVSVSSGRGTHTTRYAQLIPLSGGGFLADTPGLRQLALWAVPKDEIDLLFPEFQPYLGKCKYGNCAHVDDEGCAVREAVEREEIDARRYFSYVKLFQET